MNLYSFLADVVAVLHLAWVAFVVFALVAILVGVARRWRWVRNFWFRSVHFVMIGIVVIESLGGIICPLTTWEYDLRIKGGEMDPNQRPGEPESFVGRFVHKTIFFEVPNGVLNVCYFVFGAVVLLMLILAPPRRPWRRSEDRPG